MIVPAISTTGGGFNQGVLPNGNPFSFQPSIFGGNSVSWQGLNDLSARPNATGPNGNASLSLLTQAQQTIVLNTAGRPDQPREPIRLLAVRQ